MRFRLLGPLEVWDGDRWSAIRSGQQRTVLAVLLIEVGRVVSTDRLVDEIWGERPPRTAANAVQGYVMRLRKLMGDHRPLLTVGRGYRLVAEDGDLDTAVFDRLVETGKHDLTQRRLSEGATRLAEALALWRGPALADVPACPAVATAAQLLEQSRLSAVEDRVDAELDLGRHTELVDELHRLVGEAPLRERLLAQLMLALSRCGRRGEALAAYRTGCRVLRDELGVGPGTRLRELESAILAEDSAATGRAVVTRGVPAQLPADVAGFTGRASQLRALDQCVPTGAHLAVVTITGAGGVGKTALAVHWAHRARHRFPDGQLYVNLRGHAAPVRPVEALAGFLRALGVPAEDIPVDEDLAAAEFRSRLADTRTLVVLDNAGDVDHVRPLLPGSPGCLVLVTGRDWLRGLTAVDGAVPLPVDALTEAESLALLARLVGDRVTAEPRAAGELGRLCGNLPLALRVVAADLSAHPRRTLAGHVARLRVGDRLGALEVAGDRRAGIRTAIDHSYDARPAPARRLFRLLGLVPGPDVTAATAAALAGVPAGHAAGLLDQLAAANLVAEHEARRYSMHDLLRRYATEKAGAQERDTAIGQLLRHYLTTADVAARMLYPEKLRLPVPGAAAVLFDDHAAALAWLDAERLNLVAAIRHAAAHGRRVIAYLLADTLRGYFDMRMYTVDWLAAARLGLSCAEREGDLRAQAAARLSLALLDWKHSRYPQAAAHYTRALTLAGRAGWPEGRGAALGNLGKVYADVGRLEQAAAYYAEALTVDRRTTGQAVIQGNLGEVYLDLGRLDDAMRTLTQALDLHRQAGSRGSEAVVLRGLALVHRARGDRPAALRLATEAVAVARGIGGQRQLAKALNAVAVLHHEAGRSRLASAASREALTLARDRGDRCGEIEALTVLAAVCRDIEHVEDALTLARRTGARALAARAEVTLAELHLAQGRLSEAAATAETALSSHAETGQRLGQARAHLVLANTFHALGDERRECEHRHAATRLHTECGAIP